MNFDVFLSFMMNWIRLEPNLWIKSSEMHAKITKSLKEKFGDGLGAEPGTVVEFPPNPLGPTDLNDERVIQQNQNAIENYKRYIE
jgi:hypothetical protein